MAQRDLLVIGGGVAGLVVASVAAQLGLAVTLVEAEGRLGGDCLHYGCVPSKALIRAARAAYEQRRAAEWGITTGTPAVDLAAVMAYVRRVIDTIQRHDDPERFRGYGCEVIFGPAHFVGPDAVDVDGRRVRARRIVIATGSLPLIPPVPGLAEAVPLTNRTLFDLDRLPARLAVLGGGPTGIEMAQAFHRLGSRVTVLQRGPRILPREDADAGDALTAMLAGEGIDLQTGVELARVRRDGGATILEWSGGSGAQEQTVDTLLVAAGRVPNTAGLNLEAAGVAANPRGVRVDARLRTSNPRIFACGDVCGPLLFTHTAEYQAGVVLANALFRVPRRVDYRAVPLVTYTDPELARVGLGEAEAAERGIGVSIARFDFAHVDRAVIEGEPAGFVKLLVSAGPRWRGGGRLLGATLLGARAGELLPELTLAVRKRLRLTELSETIHAYPTLAEANRRAANALLGKGLFHPSTRRLVGALNRWLP